MVEPEHTTVILRLRVHSDTGGAELEGMSWKVAALPEADGDFSVSIPLADRAATASVLSRLLQMNLALVTLHIHPA